MGKPFKDLTGQLFGAWTVTEHHQSIARPDGHGCRTHWFCICQCETQKWVDATNLTGGISTNCGCLRETTSPKQQAARSAAGKANRTHGQSGTHLYREWASMKVRINSPSQFGYYRYGGRGITYCPEWEKFEPFRDWALANGYHEPLSIERIDHDGNYTPENCTWIPRWQQAWNTCRSVRLPSGELLGAFCDRTGVPYHPVWHALKFYREYPDQWAEVFSTNFYAI